MNAISITNVHVFDGTKLTVPTSVFVKDGSISSEIKADNIIDGKGGTLLPGLIDSHIHLSGLEDLKLAAQWGITTMLDMATKSPELVDSLRNLQGLTDIRSCYQPASAAGSVQTTRMNYPASSIVTGADDAKRFVIEQIALGADYIKIIIEDPAIMGPAALAPEIVEALVQASHKHNKMVFAHVTSVGGFQIGIDAGVDVLTHAPLEAPLPQPLIDAILKKGIITVPTMIMLEGVVKLINSMPNNRRIMDFHNVEITVGAMHRARIPIIAGTDANVDITSPFQLSHGESLHDEFELLVKAGMTPVQVLQSATSIPAKLLHLEDRGVIEIGRRADLVLVDGDPTADIKVTKAIKGVWINGVQVK